MEMHLPLFTRRRARADGKGRAEGGCKVKGIEARHGTVSGTDRLLVVAASGPSGPAG